MKERGNVLSPRNVATLPWKLEVEFDDTLTCKLYSQLSFSVCPLLAFSLGDIIVQITGLRLIRLSEFLSLRLLEKNI